MADQQWQERFTPPDAGATASAQHLRKTFDGGLRHEQPGQTREEEWQQRLQSLQEWICELLIQNQQLRMSLLESTNRQTKEKPQ